MSTSEGSPRDPRDIDTRPASGLLESSENDSVPSLTVLAHPDPNRIGEQAFLSGLLSGKPVLLSRLEPLFIQPGQGSGRWLEESRISRKPFRFLPSVDGRILDSQALDSQALDGQILARRPFKDLILEGGETTTALEIDGQVFGGRQVLTSRQLRHGVVLLLARRVVLLLRCTADPVSAPPYGQLIGESAAMAEVREKIFQVRGLKFPILLRGETGTGKELVARAIHDAGREPMAPYVAVNMGGIPRELVAAQLFGSVKGAFTGADRNRKGYFQQAEGGTIFLDEIGEAPPEVQIALLRVLETRQVQPVGAETAQEMKVRIVSATDADLEAASEEGNFRSPLLHRLRSYEISLPPLRDRLEDLGRLFYYFLKLELAEIEEEYRLRKAGDNEHSWVPPELVARLAFYRWPGNVRELRSVARRLVVASRGAKEMKIDREVEELLPKSVSETSPDGSMESAPDTLESPLQEPEEKEYRLPGSVSDKELLAALKANTFNIHKTAEALNVSRSTLYKLIELSPNARLPKDLGREEILKTLECSEGDIETAAKELGMSKRGLVLRMKQLGLGSKT